ncbi:MAG: hypothetical protein ABI723_21150 [Bacteroidia bacterium]
MENNPVDKKGILVTIKVDLMEPQKTLNNQTWYDFKELIAKADNKKPGFDYVPDSVSFNDGNIVIMFRQISITN